MLSYLHIVGRGRVLHVDCRSPELQQYRYTVASSRITTLEEDLWLRLT